VSLKMAVRLSMKLSVIFQENEKVGVIMVLSAGEEWTPGVYTACMQV